jgi:hypothetical protein
MKYSIVFIISSLFALSFTSVNVYANACNPFSFSGADAPGSNIPTEAAVTSARVELGLVNSSARVSVQERCFQGLSTNTKELVKMTGLLGVQSAVSAGVGDPNDKADVYKFKWTGPDTKVSVKTTGSGVTTKIYEGVDDAAGGQCPILYSVVYSSTNPFNPSERRLSSPSKPLLGPIQGMAYIPNSSQRIWLHIAHNNTYHPLGVEGPNRPNAKIATVTPVPGQVENCLIGNSLTGDNTSISITLRRNKSYFIQLTGTNTAYTTRVLSE